MRGSVRERKHLVSTGFSSRLIVYLMPKLVKMHTMQLCRTAHNEHMCMRSRVCYSPMRHALAPRPSCHLRSRAPINAGTHALHESTCVRTQAHAHECTHMQPPTHTQELPEAVLQLDCDDKVPKYLPKRARDQMSPAETKAFTEHHEPSQ